MSSGNHFIAKVMLCCASACSFLLVSINGNLMAAVTYGLVARSGDAAPGAGQGVVFDEFIPYGPPGFNDAGQSLFLASIIDSADNSPQGLGLWSQGTGTLQLVARTGDQAPGAGPGITFAGITNPVINDAGRVVFAGELSGPGVNSTNRFGIWSNVNGSLELIAREGDQAPGLTPGAVFENIKAPLFNDAGHIAFHSGLNDPGVSFPFDQAIWSNRTGALTAVARAGDAAPGTETGTTYLGLGQPLINGVGDTAFRATLTGPSVLGSNFTGIWSEQSGVLDKVVRSGDAAPDTGPGVTLLFDRPGNFSFNTAGQTAFSARLVGPGVDATNDRGIWSDVPGEFTLIARTGDHPFAPRDAVFSDLYNPRINGNGLVFYSGELTGPGIDASNDTGIWLSTRNQLGLLSRFFWEGSNVDGYFPLFPDYESLIDYALTTDEASDLYGVRAILASVTGDGIDDTNDVGLWMSSPSGSRDLVIRKGFLFDVDPDPASDDLRTIADIHVMLGSNGEDGLPSGLNSQHQIAVALGFTDGSSAIINITAGMPGELDGDGFVGISDLNIVLSNWNQTVTPGSPTLGDVNGDGFVGLLDLNEILNFWNTGTHLVPINNTTPIPEPAGLGMLIGLGVLVRGRNSLRPAA